MADNSYSVEIKPASKNGWFTPAESNNYYAARYARDGITVHWWGDGTGASNHDNIVNYMNSQAAAGIKSVNYVLSDNKITLCVSPDNVAWCSQGGNPTTISVETQPTLGAEGYKKWGWLVDQLEQRYGKTLRLYRHSDWYATGCPGTIDLNRIRVEADKWKSGVYDKPVVVEPVLTPVQETLYTLDNAKLVNIKDLSVVKSYPLDTPIAVGATTSWNGKDFYLSEYARDHATLQGFLVGDLKATVTPPPAPEPEPTPVPVPPTEPPVLPPVIPPMPEPTTPTPPKVIVPPPTYYRLWDLVLAILKKLFGVK